MAPARGKKEKDETPAATPVEQNDTHVGERETANEAADIPRSANNGEETEPWRGR